MRHIVRQFSKYPVHAAANQNPALQMVPVELKAEAAHMKGLEQDF